MTSSTSWIEYAEAFKLKKEHILLLSKCYIEKGTAESMAPCIDPNRPFGHLYQALDDIAEILDWVKKDKNGETNLSKEIEERAQVLFDELDTALQIVLSCMTFEPGIYEVMNGLDKRSWKRMT